MHVLSLILNTESHLRVLCISVNIFGDGKLFCTGFSLNSQI